ncbi:hypothetical protein MLD38_032250 [Melastoma candidum]|uniref:Uncharacterized protein n=1 Tax=Melastoma candidum TaxID=119954 RepID=A0ACB9M3I4_9MYRT|nr:hypothetical protein MLD38_032250 [Melastoma candidum]
MSWVQGASAISNMGMFIAEMSSDSFQLLGMAERGMLPEIFAKRSRYGTPLLGIIFSASGVVLLSWLSFQEIVAAENFLYCFGMIMEFIAFVKLRVQQPSASRPYKIPIGTTGAILMCIPPTMKIIQNRHKNNSTLDSSLRFYPQVCFGSNRPITIQSFTISYN